MSERELPNAAKSELSLLSILLHDKDNKAIEECLERKLKPSMFFLRRLRFIACACFELYAKDKELNKENVLKLLKERGKLEYVSEKLVKGLYTLREDAIHTAHHVEIIKDKAFRRELVKRMQKAVNIDIPDGATNQELADAINQTFISAGKGVTAEGVGEAREAREFVHEKVWELLEEAEKRGFHPRGTLWLLKEFANRLHKNYPD